MGSLLGLSDEHFVPPLQLSGGVEETMCNNTGMTDEETTAPFEKDSLLSAECCVSIQ